MGGHRAPDTGEILLPGPVAPNTQPIKLPGQGRLTRTDRTGMDVEPPPTISAVADDHPSGAERPSQRRPLPRELTEVDPRLLDGPAPKRPEPVLDAARVAGAISAVILAIGGLLKLAGIVVPDDYDLQPLADQAATAVLAVAGAWTVVGPWITARIRARDKVTPLADPRDAYGRRLTPEEP